MAVSLREVLCFGRYEPLFRVAAGGMAEVYAARIQGEAGFQKLVAVKRMLPHLASEPGFVDMFLNEAKLAAYVASPHVVQTLDLGRGSDGSLYIVMELVVGLSLARLIEGRSAALPIPIALELMAQAAQGLDDAHEAQTPAGDPLGLIHRDVSPHNILVGIDGRVRVTDFGIARAIHRPRAETNVRELKGKFAYMSPEQTQLELLDRRSDVFSLGVVLWEVLAGRRLFAHRDPMEAIRLVQRRPVPPPHVLRPEIPDAVSAVVLAALERDPARRFQSAGELAIALRRAARASYGEPPLKKEITAFVETGGGAELARLQRLIRLGTEGAAPEAIEAVQPGVTKVLAGEASGVAIVGTGARHTDVLDSEEDLIGPPTVMIERDPTPPETATAMVLGSVELAMAELDDGGTDRAPRPRVDPPTVQREIAPEPAETSEVTRVSMQLPMPPARRRHVGWIVAAAIVAPLALGVGVAVALLSPPERPSAVLPLAAPEPSAGQLAPPVEAGEEPPAAPSAGRAAPVPSPVPTSNEPAPNVPPVVEPRAAPSVDPERDELASSDEAARPSASPEHADPTGSVEAPRAEADPPEAHERRPARPRRGRRRRAARVPPARRDEPATARTPGAPLLDVSAFDRRPR